MSRHSIFMMHTRLLDCGAVRLQSCRTIEHLDYRAVIRLVIRSHFGGERGDGEGVQQLIPLFVKFLVPVLIPEMLQTRITRYNKAPLGLPSLLSYELDPVLTLSRLICVHGVLLLFYVYSASHLFIQLEYFSGQNVLQF